LHSLLRGLTLAYGRHETRRVFNPLPSSGSPLSTEDERRDQNALKMSGGQCRQRQQERGLLQKTVKESIGAFQPKFTRGT